MLDISCNPHMASSIFLRIYTYRQRENNSPLENFIIEIFTYCLENDPKFRNDFFSKILNVNIDTTNLNISTQQEYEGYGRPDIEISDSKSVFLFECKVEAGERENQLEDYSLLLMEKKSQYKDKHLIYLTKYFEHKDCKTKEVTLHLIRWFEVYEIIKEYNKEITKQLKLFLKEQHMEKIKNFNLQDLLAMKTIPETITKMDELLEHFKPEFGKEFGGFSKDSSRSTRLPNNLYINYVSLFYDKAEYFILIGFFWWWDELEIPYLGISIEIPKRKFENSEFLRILDKELIEKKGWEFADWDTEVYYSAFKPLSDFITAKDDNFPAMKKYLYEQLKTLYELRKKYPKLFTKKG